MKRRNRTFWGTLLILTLAGCEALSLGARWLLGPGEALWGALLGTFAAWALLWAVGACLCRRARRGRRQMEEAAFYDPETGFYNRTKFYLDAAALLREWKAPDCYALLLFHQSPAHAGRAAEPSGRVASRIGEALQRYKKPEDLFARLYGSQFEALCRYRSETELVDFIEKVCSSAREAVSCGVLPLPAGTAEVKGCEERVSEELARADRAGRLYAFYREKPKEALQKEIVQSMKRALEDGEFVMYLQPKYDLEQRTVCGAEALVRWKRPDGTTVLPSDFIGVFEQNGFITKVDLNVLEQACVWMRDWLDKGRSAVPVSINVSRKYIFHQEFVSSIVSIVDQYAIPHDLLEFDITGTSISLNVDTLREIRTKFYGREFGIALDELDGYGSAFNILDELPVDTIKLGRAFFANARGDSKVFDAIRNILVVLQKRGISVVAEGIETKEQMDLLKDLHCRVAQGYYFSRALPVQEFETLLSEGEGRRGEDHAG